MVDAESAEAGQQWKFDGASLGLTVALIGATQFKRTRGF
jgi:hypothetical protein